ncbi:MAG: IPT/TIG domain-containing protein [Blastocatellia bacterium]
MNIMNRKKVSFLFSLATFLTLGVTATGTGVETFAQTTQTDYQDDVISAAARQTPQITSARVVQAGDNPLIEINGSGFSKGAKVMVNENGILLEPDKVKKKKITVQIPNSSLCSGNVVVRVISANVGSNTSSFSYQKSAPVIYSFSQSSAQPGASLEIKADNLACDPTSNLVTLNDNPVPVLAVNMDKLTIRIPENFNAGKVKIRVTVGSQSSLPTDFTIDEKPNSNNNVPTTGSDNILRYLSTAPAGSSFAPMFAIREMVKDVNAPKGEVPLWDMNFYGTHQAIIDLPFSVEGIPQKALLTINCREVANVFGNFSGEKERFVYALISFPRNPEKLYHSENNPFFWGACSIATESNPSGGVIFNSLARAGAGIDSFEISKTANSNSKATMTFRLIAPDLGVYEPYGINYAAAGNGQVKLPKVLTVTVEMDAIQPNIPASKFLTGKVTYKDFANGSMTTKVETFSNTFSITDVPEFGLINFN